MSFLNQSDLGNEVDLGRRAVANGMLPLRLCYVTITAYLASCCILRLCSAVDMNAVLYEKGGVENLRLGVVAKPSAGDKQVLIRAHCTALNRADLLQRKGLYNPPLGASEILGLEVAGVIDDVGPNCEQGFKKGDEVMALLSGGGYAEYVSADEAVVMPVPRSLQLSEAAAIPETWLTAYQLLHFLGKAQRGETALIHAGGSGVGTAAVQLCGLAGVRALVTAGSEEKIAAARALGAEAGFNYKTGNFSEWVLEHTENVGVNLILDCVGSSFWQDNIKSLAVDGRWMLYGLMGGGDVHGDLLRNLMKKRGSLIATSLRSRSLQYKASLVAEFSDKVLPHFSNGGRLKPVIDSVFPLERVREAQTKMERNLNTGKILLQVSKDTQRDGTNKSEL